jgi:hypothetical protein
MKILQTASGVLGGAANVGRRKHGQQMRCQR